MRRRSALFLLEKSKSTNFAILNMYFHSGHKQFGMCTNVCFMCSNWVFPQGVKDRQPNSMLGSLIRKFWPGYYTPLGMVPGGATKLATTWADYQAAPAVGFLTAADAVITKFWVRHISRASFIVDDPNVLTHDSHNCFMHD